MKQYTFPVPNFLFSIFPYIIFYMAMVFSANFFFYKHLNIADQYIQDNEYKEALYRPTLDISDLLYVDSKGYDCLHTYCRPYIRENKIFEGLKSIGFAMVGTYDHRNFGFIDVLFFLNPLVYNVILLLIIAGFIFKKLHMYQFYYIENETVDNGSHSTSKPVNSNKNNSVQKSSASGMLINKFKKGSIKDKY